jgi:hypothetical protein
MSLACIEYLSLSHQYRPKDMRGLSDDEHCLGAIPGNVVRTILIQLFVHRSDGMKIEDYALIGDCQTAALVGRDGSIDWLCWPRFDSPACFALLLGGSEHGRWKIAPAQSLRNTRRAYRRDTLILETEFETDQGAVTLIDFMPVRNGQSHLIRIVAGRRGR